jgi:tetratricopeptide (TPR) repeat protein
MDLKTADSGLQQGIHACKFEDRRGRFRSYTIIFGCMRFSMRKMKNLGLVLFGALVFSILFSAWPVFAQNSVLEVKCADSSDAATSDVKVTVVHLNTKKSKDRKSDLQGLAVFDKMEDGVYRVFGRKEGFAPALFEYVMLKGAKESVVLKFAAGEDKKLYFEDPDIERNAAALLKQGIEAFNQNNVVEAEKFFNQSLAINPSDGSANYAYGVALLRQGKFEEGANVLKKAIAVADMLKTLPSAAPAGKLSPNERIMENVQQQLQQIPAMKGEAAFKQQKYDDAVTYYNEAIKNLPNRPDLYANLARALTQADKNDEALVALSKAMDLKPGDASYAGLKDAINKRKESAAIKKAQAMMLEGKSLLESDDAAGALNKFLEANSMLPQGQSPLWKFIGLAQAKLNHPDEAIAAFKKALELASPDKASEYQTAFAQFYLDNKKNEEAVDVLADPKFIGSKNPEQVLLEWVTKLKNQNPGLAETALERVIKINPGNAVAYYDLGRLYFSEGKTYDKRTKEVLTKFIEISTDAEKLEDAKGLLLVVNKRSK